MNEGARACMRGGHCPRCASKLPRDSRLLDVIRCQKCAAELIFDQRQHWRLNVALGLGSTVASALVTYRSGWTGGILTFSLMVVIGWLCYPWLARYRLMDHDRIGLSVLTAVPDTNDVSTITAGYGSRAARVQTEEVS